MGNGLLRFESERSRPIYFGPVISTTAGEWRYRHGCNGAPIGNDYSGIEVT